MILRTLRNSRQLLPDESSPAAVRAFPLAGKVNPETLRALVVIVGVSLALFYFLR